MVLLGLQFLAIEEFRVNENNRLFSFAKRANRALDAAGAASVGNPNGLSLQNGQAPAYANRQQFSLPSSESYYGGPSRFQSSSYSSNQNAYGGAAQLPRQSLLANNANFQQSGFGNGADMRPKILKSYPVSDWMPWGFLAAGTIISLYTNSTGSRHSEN